MGLKKKKATGNRLLNVPENQNCSHLREKGTRSISVTHISCMAICEEVGPRWDEGRTREERRRTKMLWIWEWRDGHRTVMWRGRRGGNWLLLLLCRWCHLLEYTFQQEPSRKHLIYNFLNIFVKWFCTCRIWISSLQMTCWLKIHGKYLCSKI